MLLLVPIKLLSGMSTPVPLLISPWLLLAGIAAALLGGALAGSLPAWQAARLRPLVALRYL
jgi:ABC-type lipoprotein release transport system permease subunit